MEDDKTSDKFASIIEFCHCSSSQEEILTHSNFAGEPEVTSGECKESTVEVNSGGSQEKPKGGDEMQERESCEFVANCADCQEVENLGFRKRSSIDGGFAGKVKLDERIEVGSEEIGEKVGESPLKKTRVSSNNEEIETPRVVGSTDLKAKTVSPLNTVALEGGQSSEKEVSEGVNEEQAEACPESPDKEKLEIENRENDSVVNGVENESSDTNEGELNGSDKVKDSVSNGSKMQGKRELPRSLLGQVWVEGDDQGRNGADGSETRKDGLDDEVKDDDDDGSEKERCKSDDAIVRNLFDVLRILAIESRYSESGKVDIFETAKRRGMKFPRSRFRM